MRLQCLYGVCALVVWVTGCGASPESTSSTHAAQVSSFRAPTHLCATVASPKGSAREVMPASMSDFMESDENLLSYATMSKDGSVNLDSEGASVGYILAQLGTSAGVDIVIRGRGASVPIFGYYEAEGVAWRPFISMLAASAGMLTVEMDDVIHVLDPHEAAELQRQINRRGIVQTPPVTRPFTHPEARTLAPALAHTLLSCEEDLTLVASRETMFWRARPEAHAFLVDLLAQIEDISPGDHRSWPISSSRRELDGVSEPRMPSCELPTKHIAMSDDLSLLGMRLYTLLMETDSEFLLGCGSMMSVYSSGPHGSMLEGEEALELPGKFLRSLGLRPIQQFYTMSAMAAAFSLENGGLQKPSAHIFMALRVKHAPLLAEILRAHFPDLSPSQGTAHVIFLRGEAARVEAARQFALNLDAQR